MGDDRKPDYDYEMAPQSEDGDVEKGKVDNHEDEKKAEAEKEVENEWGGLNKAELLEVADTPFWNWTRNILLILFWVGWVAMLVAAIVIVVKVPRCPEVEWWEKSVFYRVFPQSFKDSNGDGYGDLKGLTKKIDYIKGIGADVLVLSSIFEQPDVSRDLGQDIINFTNVDPTLGSLGDFEALIAAAGEQELKVILEFVPNHSSDKHPWFLASANGTGNFSDYYVWQDCDGTNPPNNWLNKYGDSAWTYHQGRGKCYYHYLLPEQPDLNYENAAVQAAMKEAMQYWFTLNVDGFIFSGVDYIFESGDMTTALGNRRRRQANGNETTMAPPQPSTSAAQPEPTTEPKPEPTSEPEPEPTSEPEPTGSSGNGLPAPQYSCVGEGCSMSQKKLHALLVSWRDVFNENSYLGKYRVMVAETDQAPAMAVQLFGNGSREADLVLYKGFAKSIDGPPTAASVKMAVSDWIAAREENFEKRWNTWVLGDEHMSRIATRAGDKFARAMNFILLTLPGTPISYYGEELGTPDLAGVPENMDPVSVSVGVPSRDPERGPMFWANTTTGNFTNSTAWLPLPSDPMYSVEIQDGGDDHGDKHGDGDKDGGSGKSALKVYQELIELHGEPSMTAGVFEEVSTPDSLYAYLRQFPDWPGYLVITNFGASAVDLDFEVKVGDRVITEAKFKLSSTGMMLDMKHVAISDLSVQSGESILLEI